MDLIVMLDDATGAIYSAFLVEEERTASTFSGHRSGIRSSERTYEKGIKVSDVEMKALNIDGDEFHPEWNYTINHRTEKT